MPQLPEVGRSRTLTTPGMKTKAFPLNLFQDSTTIQSCLLNIHISAFFFELYFSSLMSHIWNQLLRMTHIYSQVVKSEGSKERGGCEE